MPVPFCSKQKYAKKKLLALDSRSGLLEVDTFFIPSCCVCQLIPDMRSLGTPPSEEKMSSVVEGTDNERPQQSPPTAKPSDMELGNASAEDNEGRLTNNDNNDEG